MECSKIQMMYFEDELKELNKRLIKLTQEKKEALTLGDLSENAEYEEAKKEFDKATNRKLELENIISEAKVIETDYGLRIGIGCYVKVELVEPQDNSLEENLIFRLDAQGITINDDIMNRVLSVHSALGKAILNGTSGLYTIITQKGKLVYRVTKLSKDEVEELYNKHKAKV